MKKIFVMMFALLTGVGAASAQEQVTTENDPTTVQTDRAKEEPEKLALQKEVYFFTDIEIIASDGSRNPDCEHGFLHVFHREDYS